MEAGYVWEDEQGCGWGLGGATRVVRREKQCNQGLIMGF